MKTINEMSNKELLQEFEYAVVLNSHGVSSKFNLEDMRNELLKRLKMNIFGVNFNQKIWKQACENVWQRRKKIK